MLPWCRFNGTFLPSHRKPTRQDQAGPGTHLGAHLCAHLWGLEVVFSPAAKALVARRCLCPPGWKDTGLQGWGEPQPFLADVLSGQGTTSTGELGAIKMRTYDLSGLRKVQGKFASWFILFLCCVFYYTSWQRTCSEEEKAIWEMFFPLLHFFLVWDNTSIS